MTTLNAIIACKCPRCHKGNMFTRKLTFLRASHMLSECSECHLRYEIELGFFWAAMYVSYAMNVLESLFLAISINLITGSSNPWLYTAVLVSAILLLVSFNFRYSRVLLLYLFGGITYEHQ